MMALRDLIATPGEIVAAAITKEFRFDGNALADLTALVTEHVNEEVKLARYAASFGARSQAIDDCIKVVRELVRNAYNEGFNEGCREHTTSRGGKSWMESDTCKALPSRLEALKDTPK
jgi:hypothetical protein